MHSHLVGGELIRDAMVSFGGGGKMEIELLSPLRPTTTTQIMVGCERGKREAEWGAYYKTVVSYDLEYSLFMLTSLPQYVLQRNSLLSP